MSPSKRALIGLTFLVSALIVTTFAIVAAREISSQEVGQATPASGQNLPAALPNGPVQVVRFTLYDVGIYPREAHVGAGLVAITIENQSGGSSGLVVERVDGEARLWEGSVDRLRSSFRARGELLLTAGRYEVHDAERPRHKALLIVER